MFAGRLHLVLVGSLVPFALSVPYASAGSATGAEMLRDSGRELVRYKFEAEKTRALFTEAGRSTLVSQVHTYCRGLEKVVPKNSPSEQDWLLNELGSGSVDRMIRAESGVEYARWRMSLLIEDCFRWVDVYKEGVQGSDWYAVGKTGALIELVEGIRPAPGASAGVGRYARYRRVRCPCSHDPRDYGYIACRGGHGCAGMIELPLRRCWHQHTPGATLKTHPRQLQLPRALPTTSLHRSRRHEQQRCYHPRRAPSRPGGSPRPGA